MNLVDDRSLRSLVDEGDEVGIRAKILMFFGILMAVTLIQLGISVWISRSMGTKLSGGAREVVGIMGESIQRNESARVGSMLLANTTVLQSTIAEVERATLMIADFMYPLISFARTSEENRDLAEKQVAEFCTITLDERMPFISGIGFSFDINGFTPSRRYYLPYAYRENNTVVFSDALELPEGKTPDSMSENELDEIIQSELSRDYYLTVIPRGHDPLTALPQQVKWTTPYIDPTTRYLMISAVTPLSFDGRVVGAAFLDLALTDLDSITSSLAASLTPGTEVMIFDLASQLALSAPGLEEWKAETVNNPDEPGTTMQRPSSLQKNELGRRTIELAASVTEDRVTDSAFQREGNDYTLFVGNVHGLFGVAALLPDAELFADTRNALERAHDLEDVQNAEMRKIFFLGLFSFLAMILVGILVVLFVIGLTRQLADIVNKLNRDASGVSQASNAINSLASDLAEDTAKQASELASTASSLSQISAKVKTNADASETCYQVVSAAREHVTTGSNQMNQMNDAMTSIAESSLKIADIIKTIESISFQTNLLALNAAVEASRAGEAGKGFAVVADEVRNLAGRSAEAARASEELIEETTQRVNAGTQSVTQMEGSFKDILSGVTEAAEWVGKIRESTTEQAEAISAINSSVSSLDTAVKRNEQAAGESASTSTELADQASSLTGTSSELARLMHGN